MGQQESKESTANEESNTLNINGQAEIEKFINAEINRLKSENLRLAVAGRTATGKSSFINAMRSVDPNNDRFAASDYNDQIRIHGHKKHLTCKQIIFEELKFEKEKYLNKILLSHYDYFIIVCDNVIHEEDYWVITQLNRISKPYCLVRSKIDVDIDNGKYDGYNPTDIIPNIRIKIDEDLKLDKYPLLHNLTSVFLISSKDKSLGDMAKLEYFINNKLTFEIVMYKLNIFSRKLNQESQEKFQKLLGLSVAVAVAIWAIIPARSGLPLLHGVLKML